MFKNLRKAGLSILLVIALLLLQTNTAPALAAENLSSVLDGQSNSETAFSQEGKDTKEEIQKSAAQKAQLMITAYGITSVQYALIDDGEIVVAGQAGMADKKSMKMPTENTLYGIGSISKVFTTAAVMQLVEQGKVELDAPVTQYIPEFTMADERYKAITVRMLLNHSSGLMGSTFSNTFLFEGTADTATHDILNILKDSSLKADPGAYSVYCNDGFTLAELLVEKVSGLSFTEYLNQNISKPLGLANTKTPADTLLKEQFARTYRIGFDNPLPIEKSSAFGCAGIYSTAKDLCKFAEVFMEGQNKLLAATSTEAMSKEEYLKGIWPKEEDGVLSYGLGWDCVNAFPFDDYGIKALTKGGDTLVYHGSLVVLPKEGMAMAVLTSGGTSGIDQVFAQSVMLEELKAKNDIKEIKPQKALEKPVKTPIPDSFMKYEGVYANFGSLINISFDKAGVLNITDPTGMDSAKLTLTYSKDGKFYTPDGGSYLSITEESNGKTYLYGLSYTNLYGLGQALDSGYQYQKLENNPITEELKAIWKERSNKKYFIINESYNSELYLLNSLVSRFPVPKDLEGVYFNTAILSENKAKTALQIPGNLGRDLSEITFMQKDGTEYLKFSGYLMIAEDSIKTISAKAKFICKIGSDGYAGWYKTGKTEKKIKVKLPKNASFSIYDSNMNCTFNSLITGKNTATLPKNGFIVFAGDPNASFTVSYIK